VVDDVEHTEQGTRSRRDTRQQRGWYWYDWANSSFPTTVLTVFFGPYLIEVARAGVDASGRVSVFGWMLQPEQLFFYAIPASALIQIVTLPILGAFVDRSEHKRRWLAGTAYLGAALTIGMFFIVPGAWQMAVVLIIVANVAFQASVVVYDSFLPEIATADDRDRVSSRGWALGYIGGGLLLAINLVIYLLEPAGISGALAARVSLASAGVWWAIFTIIPLRMLEDGPAIRSDGTTGAAVRGAFRELLRTTRQLADYPETLKFLVAFLLFNGGVGTVIVAAGSYAISELEIGEEALIAAILMVQFVAFFGALVMGRIAERAGAKTVVMWSLVLWSAVVTYGRFVPAGDVAVFFALAAAIGFVLGGTQALSRSLFSHLIPAQREAEFYSFYQISDRGTNILGPAALAWAYGVFGSYRQGILVLIVFFIAGGLVLALTDMRKGIDAVGNVQPRVL
jgi:MFS transporter, UMF1 family